MANDRRDRFSSRLHEEPDEAHLEYHRVPKFKKRMEFLWEPLLALNRAQAIALAEAEIVTQSEMKSILNELNAIESRTNIDEFDEYREFEGPYFYIESFLIDALGEKIGGKIHTGRSRNDLYAAAVRIAVRKKIIETIDALLSLRETVCQRAEDTTNVVMPAFTHSQPAQPITFSHYLLAFDNLLERDCERLKNAFEITNRSPLGAAAIGGTGFSLNRERLAELSGFSDIIHNTYDSIASVDYLPQTTMSLAIMMTNISRISQDFLTWSMHELGFIELSEKMSTVSSIMPQKKNPGVLEKTRMKASVAISDANNTLVALEGVPFGDVGENFYSSLPILQNSINQIETINLFTSIMNDIEINEDIMYDDSVKSFCTMTELADTFVREAEVSFRQAHEIVGYLTKIMHNNNSNAEEITIEEVNTASMKVIGKYGLISDEELQKALDPMKNVTRKDIVGGTSPKRNEEELTSQTKNIKENLKWLDNEIGNIEAAREYRRDTDNMEIQ